MKQILPIMFGVLFAFQVMGQSFSYTHEGQTLNYDVIDEASKTVQVSDKSRSAAGELVIPSIVKDGELEYTVTAVADYAFYYCCALTSVVMPETITKIASHAFDDCCSLTSMYIPDSVYDIGIYAFRNCNGLMEIIVGEEKNIQLINIQLIWEV